MFLLLLLLLCPFSISAEVADPQTPGEAKSTAVWKSYCKLIRARKAVEAINPELLQLLENNMATPEKGTVPWKYKRALKKHKKNERAYKKIVARANQQAG